MSLVEVMVAVALLGIVAIAFYQTYNESQRHLVKGQAGQGIQCLNVMAGLPAPTGLPLLPFYP